MTKINLTLYGDIARYAAGKHIVDIDLDLTEGTVIDSLFKAISLPPEERGYLFINSVLHDAPGLYASKDQTLQEGDHVGIFSVRHMWPYQYRDGIRISEALKKAMAKSGTMRNTYRGDDK